MNRFSFLSLLAAVVLCVCSTTARIFSYPIFHSRPDFSNPMSYPVFKTTYSLDEETGRKAYHFYLNSLLKEFAKSDTLEHPGLTEVVNLWRIEELGMIPDVKLLQHLVAPLKQNATRALEAEPRRQAYANVRGYLGGLRLFNFKNQLLNNKPEEYFKHDLGDNVGAADRALYRTIKADVLEVLDPTDREDFQFTLDRAADRWFIVPMDFYEFTRFANANRTWYDDRRIYRRYLKDMYMEVDEVLRSVSRRSYEEFQYKKDLWIAEGKQGKLPNGDKGTPDLEMSSERTLADLKTVLKGVAFHQSADSLNLRAASYQFFKFVLFRLASQDIRILATDDGLRSIRIATMKLLDLSDYPELLSRSDVWNEVVEKVRSEKKKIDDSKQPQDFYADLMAYDVFSRVYGTKNRSLFKMYLKDMTEATDRGHAAAYESRLAELTKEEAMKTRDTVWNTNILADDTFVIEHATLLVNALKANSIESLLGKQLYEYLRVFLCKLEFWTVLKITKVATYRDLRKSIMEVLKKSDYSMLKEEEIWKNFFTTASLEMAPAEYKQFSMRMQ